MPESKNIISNQAGIHESLEAVVRKHLQHPFRRPIPDYSLQAFETANEQVKRHNGPIILDSFCGVGESTKHIAAAHPDALVIGIDKSLHRINKHAEHYASDQVTNYRLIRADVDDFWRLAVAANWRPIKHFLLYPNPWPKSSQLKRRCHGSPVFRDLLALGGRVEIRSNWPIYIDEFAQAMTIAGTDASAELFYTEQPITPFERKYSQSSHQLWRCICSPNSTHQNIAN
jgi:tRNA G46 methylase TrmB